MISITNKGLIFLFSALFFIASGCYAYWQEIYFIAAPVILLVALFLIQYPEYLFYLLMLSIPWSVEFNFNPALGTDLPDEPLMWLGSLSIVFFLVHQWRSIQWKKTHYVIAIILLQFFWIIITVITSTDLVVSVKYLLAKTWYLLAFLALPLFLFSNEKILKRSALVLLGSMMIVTSVILIRQGGNNWAFEKINNSVRPFFRNHVNYSSLLVFMVPLQIAIIQLTASRKVKWIFYFILSVSLIAIYMSYSRGAWLALIAGFVSYWLLRKGLLVFSFLFLLCIVISAVFWLKSDSRFVNFSNDYKSTIFHSDFREHLIATYQLKDLSNAERLYRWIAGVRMIKENWKTGFGPSTFYPQYKSYTLPAFKTYVSNNSERSTVHNYFLLLLIEQGVIGCLLMLALIIALFWYCQKVYFRTSNKFWKVVIGASTSILTMECVINFLSDMIETDKVGSIFYLCVTAIIIADIKTRKERSDFPTNIQSIS